MFSPDRHVSIDSTWQPVEAKRFIETTFEDAESVFAQQTFWPSHLDDGSPPNDSFFGPLYHGLAGVVWSQLELAELGYGHIQNEYLEACRAAQQETVEGLSSHISFNNKDDYLHGLLIAELGYLVTINKIEPTNGNSDAAIELIKANLQNTVLELLWGSPGSILYLASLIDSGKVSSKYISLLDEGLQFLRTQLVLSPSRNARLWKQNLYDEQVCLLGAGHGFAGNSLAVLRACDHLSEEDCQFWKELIVETAIRTADTEDGFSNWQQSVDQHREERTDWLVQFCHGSPGVVICLSELMGDDSEFDRVILQAGELTWKAGPVKKGSGFCHGTSGNGWAFLKLFKATGDELWLDRAKTFSAIAISQADERRKEVGQGRYSLWTGDQGVALFADACISHNFTIPTLERF